MRGRWLTGPLRGAPRERRALAAWLALVAVLAVVALGVRDALHDTDVVLPGTPAGHAATVTRIAFGESQPLLAAIDGRRPLLDRTGQSRAASMPCPR